MGGKLLVFFNTMPLDLYIKEAYQSYPTCCMTLIVFFDICYFKNKKIMYTKNFVYRR